MKIKIVMIFLTSFLFSCTTLKYNNLNPPEWIIGTWVGERKHILTGEKIYEKWIFSEKHITRFINEEEHLNLQDTFFPDYTDEVKGLKYYVEIYSLTDSTPGMILFELDSESRLIVDSGNEINKTIIKHPCIMADVNLPNLLGLVQRHISTPDMCKYL